MRLPEFLGVGTQKGGTTYLYELLKRHPQVFLAEPKEQHFFSLHWQRGVDWYRKQFASAAESQICGEITPYYLFHPEAPARIQSLLPNVKLIVLLRDPVERALSQYFHSRRLGFEHLDLEEAFSAEAGRLKHCAETLKQGLPHTSHQQHSYLSRSRYEAQLQRFDQYVAPGQILLLKSEDLFSKPELIWEKIIEFLGLNPSICPQLKPVYQGNGESNYVSSDFKRLLRKELDSTYQWMEAVLG